MRFVREPSPCSMSRRAAIAIGTPTWGVVAQYLSIDSTLDFIAGFVLLGILATPLLNLRSSQPVLTEVS